MHTLSKIRKQPKRLEIFHTTCQEDDMCNARSSFMTAFADGGLKVWILGGYHTSSELVFFGDWRTRQEFPQNQYNTTITKTKR